MPNTRPKPRLEPPAENRLTKQQRALRDAITSGPRGKFKFGGPFAIWLHAPVFGDLAQRLGAHCRYNTVLPQRLSEFAILATARWWRAQYEWQAHAPIAERAGVKASTIRDLRLGRYPKGAAADERAIYDFITELYRKRRVSDRTYGRIFRRFGALGTVELVGIIGYYALISMTLNVFRVPIDPGQTLPFAEPR
jgi:4-carboxymuconolactone decarboxylase